MPQTITDIQTEMAAYVMPRPCVGQVIQYWRHGIKTDQNLTAAIVCRVGRSSVKANVIGEGLKDDVKHATDPRLTLNTDHRESGCWDFTDEWYQLNDVVDQLVSLAFPADDNRKSPEKSAAAKRVWKIRAEAQTLGAKNVKAMSVEQCEAYIANHSLPADVV